MAKTNRPLTVLVHPSLLKTPAVVELIAKGNDVQTMEWTTSPLNYDLIIGPNCWRTVPGMEDMLDIAVKAARKQKYGKKGEVDGG